jgi:hypothetical protein
MQPKFNIDRPKISDDEINKHKDFDKLVKQFKEQSLQKARSDKSWWKNKSIKYAAVISGITVVCTVTYLALFNNPKTTSHDQIITQNATNTESTSSKTQAFIKPPIDKVKMNYSRYKVDNTKGGEIKHHSGSKIKILKNSLVNKQGELITGEVEILYRELHDQADIIAGGIPMVYDSAGTKYTFESAGMFDIRGLQNGEPVFVKEGSPISVEFNSKQSADKFNQYYLDTLAKNWKYLKRDDLPKTEIKASSTETAKAIKKVEAKYGPAIAAIPKRVDSVKVVYTRKIEKLPKPAEPLKPNKSSGRPQFELDVDYKEFPELAAYKNALFEIGIENKNFSQDLAKIIWSSADISEGPQKGRNYWLTLKLRERTEKLVVYPVLNGADYETAIGKYEEKFEKYKDLQAKREAEEKKLKAEMEAKQASFLAEQKRLKEEYLKEQIRISRQQEASLNNQIAAGNTGATGITRIFQVSRFGIFNSDCPNFLPKGQQVHPVFVINEASKPIRPDVFYLMEADRNIVYTYSPSDLSGMQIDPAVSYKACLVKGKEVFIIGKDEFSSVISSKGNKFPVRKINDDISDVSDLRKALAL